MVACDDENFSAPAERDGAGAPDAIRTDGGQAGPVDSPPPDTSVGIVESGVDRGDVEPQSYRCRWLESAPPEVDGGLSSAPGDAMADVILEVGVDASGDATSEGGADASDDGMSDAKSDSTVDGESDSAADGAPKLPVAVVERATESVAVGERAFIHVDTQPNIAEVIVRLDGVEVSPFYVDDLELGGLYSLPSGTVPGVMELSVLPLGQTAETDCVSVRITDPLFVDVAARVGIAITQVAPDIRSTVYAGMAVGDYDGDGSLDIFLSNVAVPGQMLRNVGDLDGDGIPEYLAWEINLPLDRGAGVSFADYDNDGDQDLYVGRDGSDVMLQNRLTEDGTPNFVDVTSELGLGGLDNVTTAQTWGDYDGDGDLDLYISTYGSSSDDPEMHRDRLYRNDGAAFTEVNFLLGDPGLETHIVGFAAVWVDYDMDGDIDLLASSDNETYWGDIDYRNPSRLWRNDGAHTSGDPDRWQFTEVGMQSGFGFHPDVKGDGMNAMGIAVGDVDFDGRPDVIMSNLGPNTLLYGRADTNDDGIDEFYDPRVGESLLSGIRRMWFPWKPQSSGSRESWQDMQVTWGVSMFDYDNDGDLDFYFSSGPNFPIFDDPGLADYPYGETQPEPDALFRNDGDGEFTDVGGPSGVGEPSKSGANVVFDTDDDGWLDVLVLKPRGTPRLYRNRSGDVGNTHHWLKVELQGNGTTSNRDAIGAVVSVTQPTGKTQTCFVTTRPSQGSSGVRTCHFGLGAETTISTLRVSWPDGEMLVLTAPDVDQKLKLIQLP